MSKAGKIPPYRRRYYRLKVWCPNDANIKILTRSLTASIRSKAARSTRLYTPRIQNIIVIPHYT